jgi:TolB-like protein
MRLHLRLSVRLLLGVTALSFLWVSPSTAKSPKRIAILPFTMNADRDLSFLQEGIVDMLGSRLAWKGELEVLEKGLVKAEAAGHKGALNREAAITVGKRLQVDYVVLGSLTVFGDSVSVDARILDVANSDELVTAFNQAKGMDAVIPTITQFAQDINEKVMGRPMGAASPAPAQQQGGPGGLTAEGQAFEGKGVGHTQRIKTEVVSMDAGDVDGDGKTELVLVSPDTVYVYKWAEKALVQFKTYKERFATNFLWVSVGDLDGNGRAEIYVSNAGAVDVSSFVLEWDGKGFRKIADGQRWFFRVMDMPGKGKVLIGQRRATGGGFMGSIQYLKREGSQFVGTEPVALPAGGNVYNFALVDFDGRSVADTVFLTSSELLVLYAGGEEVWRSEEPYGGTYAFLAREGLDGDRIFMPSPILITDIDEDGRKEVMVCRNSSKMGRLLDKYRSFSNGTVEFLVRDEVGLQTKWSTRRLGGATVGYLVADVDDDNLPEMVVVSVIREETAVFDSPRSRIVVFDLK